MRIYVMPLQWERKCIVQELFVALSFSLPLPLPLPTPFPKPLADPFSEPWSEPFSEPFSEPLGVNFPLPLFLPGMWERRAIGKLTFTFTLGSTWWGSNSVWKRREFVIVLLGGIVREGLLSGCAAAFGGEARAAAGRLV